MLSSYGEYPWHAQARNRNALLSIWLICWIGLLLICFKNTWEHSLLSLTFNYTRRKIDQKVPGLHLRLPKKSRSVSLIIMEERNRCVIAAHHFPKNVVMVKFMLRLAATKNSKSLNYYLWPLLDKWNEVKSAIDQFEIASFDLISKSKYEIRHG